MITTSDINTILGIKENFQLHGALKDILFDEDKKTEVFEKFLEIENDPELQAETGNKKIS